MRYDAFASQIWCCSFHSQWCDVCHSLGEATSFTKWTSLAEASSFAEGKHHWKNLVPKNEVFSGCFELNDTNEMCLKTEDYIFNLLLIIISSKFLNNVLNSSLLIVSSNFLISLFSAIFFPIRLNPKVPKWTNGSWQCEA